jgi:hypothetical protein
MGFVTEMLGDGKCRQPGSPAGAGRLIHLPEDQCGPLEHARLPKLQQQLMPLARPFADAGEDRDAGVPLHRRANQLHDQDGLADTGAAEHGGLAALHERRQEVDDLDAGMKDLQRATMAGKRGCGAMDRSPLDIVRQWSAEVRGFPNGIEQTPEDGLADRHPDGTARRPYRRTPHEPGRVLERHGARRRCIEVQRNLCDERAAAIPIDGDSLGDYR